MGSPTIPGMASTVGAPPTEEAQPQVPWIPRNTFAARLLLVRHELGISQEEAAAKCGLDDGSWSNWENGTIPRQQGKVVQTISEALGVDREWLIWDGGLLTSGYIQTPALAVVPDDGEIYQNPLPFDSRAELSSVV